MKGILLLTHSNRPVDFSRCSLNFLTRRYEDPCRLQNLPAFEGLPPRLAARTYAGGVSFFQVRSQAADAPITVTFLGSLSTKEKIQHAVMLDESRMLVTYEHQVECWELKRRFDDPGRVSLKDFALQETYNHPHFGGLHSAFPIDSQRVLVSASAADAVFVLDLRTGNVSQVLKFPRHLYGSSYHLTEQMNLHDHYIGNDFQATHVNSAFPTRDGSHVVVSTLIQGAIGTFNLQTGMYRELVKGFVGCHSARVSSDGTFYFADSTTGALIFLDQDGGIVRRFALDSRWLHDVQQIEGDVYAFALADQNELRIYDIRSEILLYRKRFLSLPFFSLNGAARNLLGFVGNSTQFLSYTAS